MRCSRLVLVFVLGWGRGKEGEEEFFKSSILLGCSFILKRKNLYAHNSNKYTKQTSIDCELQIKTLFKSLFCNLKFSSCSTRGETEQQFTTQSQIKSIWQPLYVCKTGLKHEVKVYFVLISILNLK